MKLLTTAVLVAVAVVIAAVLISASFQTTATSPSLKGVSLSPKSYDPANFTRFFELARRAGGAVTWAGSWQELPNPRSAPHVVTQLASRYDYEPIVLTGFHHGGPGADFRLPRRLDARTQSEAARALAAFAKQYRPRYLGIGVEVNVIQIRAPAEFERFVALFRKAAAAVKRASPRTRVFTVFQLELMKGFRGGLFGGVNDRARNQWALLRRFPQADLFAFTTYPGLIYGSPQRVPGGYFREIAAHTSKRIALTEVAWASSAAVRGWESSEAEQASFVRRLKTLARGLRFELVIWPFLYDQPIAEPISSMGLIRRDGTPKAAYGAWRALRF